VALEECRLGNVSEAESVEPWGRAFWVLTRTPPLPPFRSSGCGPKTILLSTGRGGRRMMSAGSALPGASDHGSSPHGATSFCLQRLISRELHKPRKAAAKRSTSWRNWPTPSPPTGPNGNAETAARGHLGTGCGAPGQGGGGGNRLSAYASIPCSVQTGYLVEKAARAPRRTRAAVHLASS
jgi:hypothetical protein